MDPVTSPGWDELVSTHPAASFVHTAAWARVISDTYGYRPFYFAAVGDGRLEALIPFMEIRSWLTGRRGVSLPFTDECDLILPEGMTFEEAIDMLREFAKTRRWRTFELRGRIQSKEEIPAWSEYYTHELDISRGDDEIFSGFLENVQRNIRKSNKGDLVIDREGSKNNLREFYRLNCLTRRDHGLPPQPFRFFESLWDHVLSKEKGALILARHRGESVAGAVFLHFGRKVIFKYGASDRRFQHLRANNRVMHEAIRSYSGQGFRTFSFGRTDKEHDGLRRFKLSWGCSEDLLRYVKFDVGSASWRHGKGSSGFPWKNVFARMPVPVLRMIGNLAYSHIG